MDAHALAETMLRLQALGANNINFVTPTPHIDLIVRAITAAREGGLAVPTVYNTNGYELVDSIKRLEGLIDIYLPDLKYVTPRLAGRFKPVVLFPFQRFHVHVDSLVGALLEQALFRHWHTTSNSLAVNHRKRFTVSSMSRIGTALYAPRTSRISPCPSALSTGACGRREIMDVTMEEPVSEAGFLEKMNRAMPPEMQLLEARAVDDRHPALMASVKAAAYDLLIRDAEEAKLLGAAIPAMMGRETVMARRKTKSGVKDVDIKPLIYSLNAKGQHIYCTLALTEGQACKPNMLMEALCREAGILEDAKAEKPGQQAEGLSPAEGCPEATDSFGNRISGKGASAERRDPVRMLVTRTCLLGEDADGVLQPLERL